MAVATTTTSFFGGESARLLGIIRVVSAGTLSPGATWKTARASASIHTHTLAHKPATALLLATRYSPVIYKRSPRVHLCLSTDAILCVCVCICMDEGTYVCRGKRERGRERQSSYVNVKIQFSWEIERGYCTRYTS